MSEELKDNKWMLMVAGLFAAWMSWMTIMIIGMKSQMDVMLIQQQNVIPPVVESSLKELREKTNTIAEATINNTKDISYLRARDGKSP